MAAERKSFVLHFVFLAVKNLNLVLDALTFIQVTNLLGMSIPVLNVLQLQFILSFERISDDPFGPHVPIIGRNADGICITISDAPLDVFKHGRFC